MKKKIAVVMFLCWTCFIFTPLIGLAETPSIQHIQDVKNVLQNLTTEQRETLNQIEVSPNSTNSQGRDSNKTTLEDKGFDYAKSDIVALTNDTPFWQHLNPPIVPMQFKLKSTMKTIDFILKEAQTGKAVGFLGTVGASGIEPNYEYVVSIYAGVIYPFTNNASNPISDVSVKVPAGDYTLEMIAYDEEGKSYVASNPLIIDNTGPQVDMDIKPGVIEISDDMFTEEDGQEAVWIHGKVHDATIDLLNSKGLDYNQSSNAMYVYIDGFPQGNFPITENGDVKFGIEKSDIEQNPLSLYLVTSNLATAKTEQIYTFLKKGTEYISTTYDKQNVKLGDTITKTLSLNNVKQFASGEFEIEYFNSILKFENAKLNNKIKQYAKEQGLNTELNTPVVTKGNFFDTVKVGAALNGKDFSGLDGDMPFLDVTFKVDNDEWHSKDVRFINVEKASYTKVGQTELTTIPSYNTNIFDVISKHSQIQGYILPEAFQTRTPSSEYLAPRDYTEIGAKVYAISDKGKKYNGTINQSGQFTISGIPASDQVYTAVVDVPGHLKSMKKFIPGKVVQSEKFGQYIRLGMDKNLTGDINGDSLIDIHDIKSVVDAYGEKGKSLPQDLNQDDVVDETDVRFVEKNFLKKGPDTSDKEQPQETIKGKDLEYFLNLIGLQPHS
ncbi:hypothetical protein [Bacillus cereus]|uniref:hypothetical protein n=1 Tax=Bacillus cereus TaxID=1396 RepID=UPI000BEC1E29|nr:hypothetical protein [Bacillus cereus]PEA06363.1 hypothetical protein CON37_01910 [Bacillus cereus]